MHKLIKLLTLFIFCLPFASSYEPTMTDDAAALVRNTNIFSGTSGEFWDHQSVPDWFGMQKDEFDKCFSEDRSKIDDLIIEAFKTAINNSQKVQIGNMRDYLFSNGSPKVLSYRLMRYIQGSETLKLRSDQAILSFLSKQLNLQFDAIAQGNVTQDFKDILIHSSELFTSHPSIFWVECLKQCINRIYTTTSGSDLADREILALDSGNPRSSQLRYMDKHPKVCKTKEAIDNVMKILNSLQIESANHMILGLSN